jgi:hypothetical protein
MLSSAVVSTTQNWAELIRRPDTKEGTAKFVPEGSCVLVPHHSFVDLLSERQVQYRLLSCFHAVSTVAEVDALTSILVSLGGFRQIDPVHFFGRWRYGLSTCRDCCTVDHLIALTQVILSFPETDRDRLFASLFLDFGLFASLKTDILAEFVDYLPLAKLAQTICIIGKNTLKKRFCSRAISHLSHATPSGPPGRDSPPDSLPQHLGI